MKMFRPLLQCLNSFVSTLCCVVLLFACSGDPLPAEDEPVEASSSTPTATAKGSTSKPPKATASATATGPKPVIPVDNTDQPKVPPHEPVFDPDYPGVDSALVPDAEVDGCADGYDAKKFTLTLTLTADVPGVRLSAKDGVLLANGKRCGAELTLEDLQRVSIVGGKEDNVVILDFSEGDFGKRLFEIAGGFYMKLADGTDQVLLRGSSQDDFFYLGSGIRVLMGALTEAARLNLWAKDVESLVVSTGPGNDVVDTVKRLNVGLYDVDTGGTTLPTDVVLPGRFYGGDGDDLLVGGLSNDYMVGGPGKDEVDGSDGSDIFDEGEAANGSDVINGGPGSDQLDYRLRETGVKLQLCLSEAPRGCDDICQCTADNGEADEGDMLINVERIWGGAGDDQITGTSADEALYGESGDDVLIGEGGSDTLQGGVGQDSFDGGDGGDICDADKEEMQLSCEI